MPAKFPRAERTTEYISKNLKKKKKKKKKLNILDFFFVFPALSSPFFFASWKDIIRLLSRLSNEPKMDVIGQEIRKLWPFESAKSRFLSILGLA